MKEKAKVILLLLGVVTTIVAIIWGDDIYRHITYEKAKDFYEDKYDDFDSFEDAEDYYNDAWDDYEEFLEDRGNP